MNKKLSYGYIYKTTNVLNNKFYIGQRKGCLDNDYFGSGKILKKAFNKYGKDSFKLKILVYAEDKNKLDELEKFYIAKYRELFGVNKLYNISDGGNGGDTISNHPNREKICQSIKKAMNNPEVQLKLRNPRSEKHQEIRICSCGCKNNFTCIITSTQKYLHGHNRKGVQLSNKIKQNIGHSNSISLKGRKQSKEVKNKIRIQMLNYWLSKRQATKVIKLK